MTNNFRVLLILLMSISFDAAYGSIIMTSTADQTQLIKALIALLLFGFGIICSPIQAGFSDFSSRRKSLIFAFVVTLVAMACLLSPKQSTNFLFFLIIAAILKGMLGNITPIARAALADSIKHNFRFAIGLSTSAIAGGYIFINLVHQYLNSFYIQIALIVTVLSTVYLIIKYYYDKYDKDPNDKPASLRQAIQKDINLIFNDFLKNKIFSLSSLAYYFWEVSFYLVFINDIELHITAFKNFSLTMCIGYLVGVLLLKLISHWHDRHVLKLGYRISIGSIIAIFVVSFSDIGSFFQYAKISGYFLYSLGFGFFVPCLFSMISKIRAPHEQGKIYGLIDSVDTIAFATAVLLDVFIRNFKSIAILSFIFLLIGTVVYNRSRKYWVKHADNLSG